jgi:hypothetical protein
MGSLTPMWNPVKEANRMPDRPPACQRTAAPSKGPQTDEITPEYPFSARRILATPAAHALGATRPLTLFSQD